ncbi:MAG: cobalamin biosynthesis protein CbiD, partial [Lachnospiraceae bacterium]|nr:cobalamin biosynthesis protein CbiD [Lachnospiraceae bacterium]
ALPIYVPREMITNEVTQVLESADFHGEVQVIISIPEGVEIAKNTFNPRLGIEGGISVLGTSGVVEPMSMQAILDTIKVELRQHRAFGYSCAAVSPGNYGVDYMKETYDYDLDKSVKCSNFIGDTIDMAAELGFECMLLTGNMGKLVKVAGGIMNTHSREGDCRMEIMTAAALQCGVSRETCLKILDCVMTDEAIRLIEEEGKKDEVMNCLLEKIMYYLNKRAAGRMEIECIVYSSKYGELAKSKGAEKWLTLLVQDQAQQI